MLHQYQVLPQVTARERDVWEMNEIVGYLVSFLSGAGVIGALLVWSLNNYKKIEALAAWFYRTFSWASHRFEYGSVATNIQTKVNSFGEELNKSAGNVLPHAMKIEWTKNAKEVETSLRKGEIIVTMDYSQNQDRNLVISTLAYLGKDLLPRVRPYVDKTLMKATDFTVAKNIFVSGKQDSAISFFFENYLEPEIEKEPQLRYFCTILDRLERVGFFSRILLRELKYMGEKVFPATPDSVTRHESGDFAEFLARVATRERGEDVCLTFARSRIRTSIMLIARQETKKWGLRPYRRRTQINLDRGIEHMYICARGAENISIANLITNEQRKAKRLEILARHRFVEIVEAEEFNVTLIACTLNLPRPSGAIIEPSSVVYRLLEEHIEELCDGRIEVVALARQPGVKSKIMVRSLSDDVNALHCCTQQMRLEAMEIALAGEKLEFVPWSKDPKEMIVASLVPLDRNHVQKVITSFETQQAIVVVDRPIAKQIAVGRGGENVKCAEELTGWRIAVILP